MSERVTFTFYSTYTSIQNFLQWLYYVCDDLKYQIDPQAGLPMVRMEFAPYTTEVMAHLILK